MWAAECEIGENGVHHRLHEIAFEGAALEVLAVSGLLLGHAQNPISGAS